MANPGYLFHPNIPKGQLYPDLTPELQRTLEGEGWVDTPARLPGAKGNDAPSTSLGSVKQAAAVPPTSGTGRTLGTDPIKEEARNTRLAKLFDADGDIIVDDPDAPVSDDDLMHLIDDMGREETVQALETLGGSPSAEDWTSDLRADLAEALRAGLAGKAEAEVEPPAKGAPTPGDPSKPISQGGSKANPGPDRDNPLDHDEDGTSGGAKANPEASVEIAPKALDALDAEAREAWVVNASNAVLQAQLTARGLTFKARDGKEELQEKVRAALPEKA